MKISDVGINFIKRHEGVRNRPYRDCIGLWTIGVGHLIGDGKFLPPEYVRIFSMEEIDELLKRDLRRFELGILKMLPNVSLRQCEYDALCSFAFNLGLGTFQRCTLRQALLRGDKKGAMESLVKYCRAGGKIIKGLQIRRLNEKALFEGK